MNNTSSHRETYLATAPFERDVAFSDDEYHERHRRIRAAMAAAHIDLLYLTSPEAICYATGYQAEWFQGQCTSSWPSLAGVAIHLDHDDWVHYETEAELMLARITSASQDLRVVGEPTMLDDIVADLRSSGRLGQGTVVGFEFGSYRPNRLQSERFESALLSHGAKIVDATPIVRAVRRMKSAQELAYVRVAQGIADVGMQAAIDHLKSGVTELDVYAEIVYAMAKAGGESPAIPSPVASGTRSGCFHALASRRVIKQGDIVNIDVCGVHHRYHANMARTFSVGEPHRTVADYVERTFGALDIVTEHLRPGVRCLELVDRLRDFYGPLWDERWWVGGYELGISFPPDWVGEFVYDDLSAPDATFIGDEAVNYEANFYLPLAAGLTCGINTVICGESATEVTTTIPNRLFVVG